MINHSFWVYKTHGRQAGGNNKITHLKCLWNYPQIPKTTSLNVLNITPKWSNSNLIAIFPTSSTYNKHPTGFLSNFWSSGVQVWKVFTFSNNRVPEITEGYKSLDMNKIKCLLCVCTPHHDVVFKSEIIWQSFISDCLSKPINNSFMQVELMSHILTTIHR